MSSIGIFAAIAFSFLISLISADAQAIALNGPWKFHTGDNLQWADPSFNDSKWEIVDLTPPPGAHDSDVGLVGYVAGWTAKGHPNYSGYAWYRIKIIVSGHRDRIAMLAAPPMVDDAYELYANGKLIGRDGDFSGNPPVVYSIMPKTFPLTPLINDSITIAIRVWVDPSTIAASPGDAGGIHIAPQIGNAVAIHQVFMRQWSQTFYGYVVDLIEPVLFAVLAIMIICIKQLRNTAMGKWLIAALIVTALVRVNQVTFFWFQFESNHDYDIAREVLLTPLSIMTWLMAWRAWFNIERSASWLPPAGFVLMVLYMLCRLLSLLWIMPFEHHALCSDFDSACNWVRLIFAFLYGCIIFTAIRYKYYSSWWLIVLFLLLTIGLFASELSAIHIPGIWFPFGVGVSRTQIAYGAFIIILLLYIKMKVYKTILSPQDT